MYYVNTHNSILSLFHHSKPNIRKDIWKFTFEKIANIRLYYIRFIMYETFYIYEFGFIMRYECERRCMSIEREGI